MRDISDDVSESPVTQGLLKDCSVLPRNVYAKRGLALLQDVCRSVRHTPVFCRND